MPTGGDEVSEVPVLRDDHEVLRLGGAQHFGVQRPFEVEIANVERVRERVVEQADQPGREVGVQEQPVAHPAVVAVWRSRSAA